MSQQTAIQWCDSTVNPTMGCDGCELWNPHRRTCYAGTLHDRYGGHTKGYAPSFDQVTQFPGRMAVAANWSDLRGHERPDKPWLNGLPRLIFVSDMSDALSKVVPFDYLRDEIIATATSAKGSRHQWLWLTKRPQRMAEFSGWLASQGQAWPTNLWAGTSITTQQRTTRIEPLLHVGDAKTIRFLSVEPQWSAIALRSWLPQLSWVIQGGESGALTSSDGRKKIREFRLEWAFDLLQQCRTAQVPFFLKQLGRLVTNQGQWIKLKASHGGDWSAWPTALQVREMPMSASPITTPQRVGQTGLAQQSKRIPLPQVPV